MRDLILSDVGMKRVPRSDAYTRSESAGGNEEGEEGAEVSLLSVYVNFLFDFYSQHVSIWYLQF